MSVSVFPLVAMFDSPLGYCPVIGRVKYTTFLVVNEWICGISVIPVRHRYCGTLRAFPPAEQGFIARASRCWSESAYAAILFHV